MITFSLNVSLRLNCIKLLTHLDTDGFFLDYNPCDAIFLDDLILKELSGPELEKLRNRDLHGYVQSPACLRPLYMPLMCTLTEAITKSLRTARVCGRKRLLV